jgi:glycosyltransferase involved in cell wall biosynthesis
MNRPKFGRLVRKIYKFRNVLWVSVRDTLKIWPEELPPHKSINNPIFKVKELNVATNVGIDHLNRLVFLGRLSVEKGIQNFLEIAKETKHSSIVIGDGSLRSNLIQEYQNLREVVFLGQRKNPWEELTQNDLLIVPSLHEGDGLVVVEAISGGVPILLSDIPEFRRFGLPEKNYCKDKNEFIATIGSYRDNLADLIVPNEIVAPILSTRSIDSIADSWEISFQTASH